MEAEGKGCTVEHQQFSVTVMCVIVLWNRIEKRRCQLNDEGKSDLNVGHLASSGKLVCTEFSTHFQQLGESPLPPPQNHFCICSIARHLSACLVAKLVAGDARLSTSLAVHWKTIISLIPAKSRDHISMVWFTILLASPCASEHVV